MTADWTDQALCAQIGDDRVFFPEPGESPRAAKAVCCKCELSAQCLDAALTNHEQFGVWGGYTAFERRPLQRAVGGAS